MIGTDIGNVHNLQQGQGLATVVNQNALLEDALWQKKAGLLEKQAKKKEAIADFDSYDPQFFYADQKEKETITEGVKNEFIRLQEKGVENPFRATDPESRELQRRAKKGLLIGEVSKKKEEKYFEFAKILQDQEKAKKIKNADEIKQWFFNTPPAKIVDEGLPFPEVEFVSPAFDVLGTNYKLGKTWVDTNGRPPSRDEAVEYAGQAIANPVYNEPDGYVQAMKQAYNQLMPEDKKEYIAKAKSKANGTLEDQVQFFIADQIYNSAGGEVDLGALMADDARKLQVSGTGNEGANWTYVKGGEKEYSEKRARSILKANIGQIERDVEKKKEYGDVNNTPEQNFEEAFKFYYPIYQANVKRDYNPLTTSGSGGADAEAEEGFNRWWSNLTYGDDFEKKDAGMFTFGSGDPQEGGVITSAEVYTPEKVTTSINQKFPGTVGKSSGTMTDKQGNKVLTLRDKIEKAGSILVVNVKDKAKLSMLQEIKMEPWEREVLNILFGTDATREDKVYYPLTDKNRQALRKVYKNAATSQGSHYKPTQQSVESMFFDE